MASDVQFLFHCVCAHASEGTLSCVYSLLRLWTCFFFYRTQREQRACSSGMRSSMWGVRLLVPPAAVEVSERVASALSGWTPRTDALAGAGQFVSQPLWPRPGLPNRALGPVHATLAAACESLLTPEYENCPVLRTLSLFWLQVP